MKKILLLLTIVFVLAVLGRPKAQAGVFIGLPLSIPVFYGPGYYPGGYYYGPYGYAYYRRPYWRHRYWAHRRWYYY